MRVRELLPDVLVGRLRILLYAPFAIRDIVFCAVKGLPWHTTWRLWRLPIVDCHGRGASIQIGTRFVACSDPRHNSLGVFQRVTLKTCGHGARIVIGDDVGMSGCTISAAVSISIGNRVLLGSGCLITDNDAHPIDPVRRLQGEKGASRPVVIEDDVFVGARAIILKGVTIGQGSVVGAGSVVTSSIPAYSVAVGNPARRVRDSRDGKRADPAVGGLS